MIKTLLGIRLRALLSATGGRSKSGEYKRPSVGRIVLVAVLLVYLVGIFIFLSTTLAISTLAATRMLGAPWLYFAIYALLPFAVVFMFSIFETKGELFECKDTALLLSLPLRPRDIVISRLLTVLLLNYAEAAVLMWPFLVVYAIGDGTLPALLGGILAYLLIPLLATALSSGIGYVIAKISARVKRKTLVTMVLYLLFFAAYFALYQSFFSASGEMTDEQMAQALSSLGNIAILRFLGEAVMLTPVPTLVFAVVSVGVSLLIFWRIAVTFVGVSTEHRGTEKRRYTARRTEKQSVFVALSKKELSRFTSSATYMMNAATGVLLSVVLTGALCFTDFTSETGFLSTLGMSLSQITPVLIMALVVATLMNFPSACALSLEGKSLWQLRSLPVRAETVLLAKCTPHVLVCSVTTLVCGTVLSIVTRASFLHTLSFLFLPILANVAAALFGIFINTAFPKLDYTSEAQPVKSSLSATLAMLLQMVFGLLLLFATLFLSMMSLGWVALLGAALLLLLVSAVMYVLVTRVSAAKFSTF